MFEPAPAVPTKMLRLARAGKVVVLPHLGSATLVGRVDMGERLIVKIKTFLDGHKPPNRVQPSICERTRAATSPLKLNALEKHSSIRG